MSRHTPLMDDTELAEYLRKHLANELEWLLRAATEWHVQNTLKLNITGYEVQVFAMDSTFLHARTLLEFFTQHESDNHYSCEAFGISCLQSQRYNGAWKNHLHAALMHAQDRSNANKGPLKSFDGQSDRELNQMPVDFAKEVVRLWREFAVALEGSNGSGIPGLQDETEGLLEVAITNARNVATNKVTIANADGKSIPPISWPGKA